MRSSSEQTADPAFERVRHLASRLLQTEVLNVEPIGGGRNSRVYKVTITGGDNQAYVLKTYFRHHADKRDRLATEFGAVQFLKQHGVFEIPEPLVANKEDSAAVYGYVNGEPVDSDTVSVADIHAAVSFLIRLSALAGQVESRDLAPASEACFSGRSLEANLRYRLERLLVVPETDPARQELHEFLTDEFIPTMNTLIQSTASQFYWERELDWCERTLSPSDFGFHNALRCGDGRLVFLDFEYFGWDDPVKTLSDFLLHPAMKLRDNLKKCFAAGLIEHFGNLPGFVDRAKAFYPLYGLKWCLILLNEFLPGELLRRQFAEADSAQADNREGCLLQKEQLSKARRMLERTSGEYKHFPYFS